MTKLSIIIPVYNAELYLEKCLDSLCHQTLKDIEIVCVNDCSLDGSLAILQEYASKDSRIKLINFTENKGAAAARNAGIEAATGEYIGFVDSDDFVDLDFYEKLYTKAKETNADVVKAKISLYLKNEKSTAVDWDDNAAIKKDKSYFIFGFTSAIYLSDIIEKKHIRFPEPLINFEDPYFLIQYISYCHKVELIDDAFYYYRDNEKSVTHHINMIEYEKSALAILELINTLPLEKSAYLIVFNSFISNFIKNCEFFLQKDSDLLVYSKLVSRFLKDAKYDDVLFFYYKSRQEKLKKDKFSLLRQKTLTQK